MSQPISHFERPQVRAVLRAGERVYIASECGLYELNGHALQAVPAWQGQPVQCIAVAPGGFLLLIENDHGQTLHSCDADWQATADIPTIPGEKIKAICQDVAGGVLAGTKSGIFRLLDGRWRRIFGEAHGRGEVLWLRSDDQRLTASVKKMGAGACPALIESLDGGTTWSVSPSPDYQDIVLAADADWIVTRWKGARRRGHPGETKKHPLSAAQIGAGGWSVLDGDKLETQGVGKASMSFYHPVIAEAERLLWLKDRVLVAGVQGAWLIDPARGEVVDLFAGLSLPAGLGKIKRLFALDDGAVLATATFGAFRSADAGVTWDPVDAEWTVLDAEQILRGSDGRWWLACQRALFSSDDNGLSWRYVKLKVKQQHYSELRGGIAIVGGSLYVGTKAGLLHSLLSSPEAVSYVPGFDRQAIEALHVDAVSGALIVGTADGALWRLAPGEQTGHRIAEVPVQESGLTGQGGQYVLVTGGQVFSIDGATLREITPAAEAGDFAMAAQGRDGFVLWNRTHAWQGRTDGAALAPIAGWPSGVRHASVAIDGRTVHTTDRRSLRRLTLAA